MRTTRYALTVVALIMVGAALGGCSRTTATNAVSSASVSKVSTMAQVIADSPKEGGTYIISRECLKKHGVAPEDVMALIAAGHCDCAKRIVIHAEETDDYESIYMPGEGDTFRVEQPGVTLVVSRACLAKHGVTPQEAVQLIASDSHCTCAKRLYIADEMTDDDYDLGDLKPVNQFRVTVR
jgi:hypothetical protein